MVLACWAIFTALLTRALFAGHSFISIWRLADQTGHYIYWTLLFLLVLLFLETIYIVRREGREWRWFSPSVIIYLLCTVPAIWFLELDRVDKYRDTVDTKGSNRTNASCTGDLAVSDFAVPLSELAGLSIPLKLTSDDWLASLQQMLVFILIVGRWLMPSRKISHEELSLLLFVYLGMGSDIMELLVLFEHDYVLTDDIAVYGTLGVWTASLLQFALVLTATRRVRGPSQPSEGGDDGYDNGKNKQSNCLCFESEVWGICVTMFLQDGPFLAARLYVIIKNQTLSYTILFFTLKNVLMLMVQMYRLFVVGCCGRDRRIDRVGMTPVTSKASLADDEQNQVHVQVQVPQTNGNQYTDSTYI